MLQVIRGKAGSWIVKILFAFLILSFGVWGIGDIFRGQDPAQEPAATVGDTIVTVAAVDQEFRRQAEQLRTIFGPDFTYARAAEMGVMRNALDQLVRRAVLDEASRRWNLLVPDQAVMDAIRTNPAFHAPGTQQFSRDVFLVVLRNNGLTEAGYVELERRNMRERLVASLAARGATAPDIAARTVYAMRQERRSAEVVTIPISAAGEPAPPAEDQLASYYEENETSYLSPEYRDLTIAYLTIDQIKPQITVADEDVRAEYDAEITSYTVPARRRFEQAILQDEPTASAVAEAVDQGASLADALAAAGSEATVVTLDWTTRDALPAGLGEPAFAAEVGKASKPTETPFGWHVLVPLEDAPEIVRPFEDAAGEIRDAIAAERALDRIYELANDVEDELAGGVALPQLAQDFGLTIEATTGVASDGARREDAIGETPDQSVLAAAIALPEGGTGRLEELPDDTGYFIVHVDRVTPPEVLPFDKVRERVLSDWTESERSAAADALAAEAKAALDRGDDAIAVAATVGGTASVVEDFLRDGTNAAPIPPNAAEALFSAGIGDTVLGLAGSDRIVARLKAIAPADPAADPEGLNAVADEIAGGIGSDLSSAFLQALQADIGVELHPERLAILGYGG